MPNELTREIQAALTAKFDPKDVDFRIQVNPANGTKGRVVAYISAATVMDRLDEVVGSGGWAYDFSPIAVNDVKGTMEMTAAKGTLTIFGVSKSALGTLSQTEASKGCDSDTLKRSAVLFGIGRYLRDIKVPPVELVQSGRSWYIPDQTLRELRAKHLGDNSPVSRPIPEPYDEPVATTRPPARQAAPTTTPPLGTRPVAGSSAWIAAVKQRDASEDATCPACQGKMWDNRFNKRNPNAPDFKCRNDSCRDGKGFVTSIFPPKPGEVAQAAPEPDAQGVEFDAEPANPRPVLSKGDALRDYAEARIKAEMPDNPDEETYNCHWYLNETMGVKTMPLEEFDVTNLTATQISLLTSGLNSGQLGWDPE